jgi:hypothetical protein
MVVISYRILVGVMIFRPISLVSLFFAAYGKDPLASKESTADKIHSVGMERLSHSCENVASQIQPEQYSSLCIYPDISYQRNLKLPLNFFSQESKKIVANLQKQIELAVQKKTLSVKFFKELMEIAGKERFTLARKQDSEVAENFGKIRSGLEGYISTPLMDDPYRDYQNKTFTNLLKLYKAHQKDLKERGVCIWERMGNITSYFHLKIVDMAKLLSTSNFSEFTPAVESLYVEMKEKQVFWNMFSKKNFSETLSHHTYIHAYTKVFAGEEEFPLTSEWMSHIPNKVVEKEKLQLEDSDPISEEISALLNEDLQIPEIRLYSSVKAPYLDLYPFFLKCIRSQTEQEFRESLSLFQYAFAQISPYLRGSSTIAEWFMQALCKARNYVCSCRCGSLNGKCSLDLAALTSLSVAEYGQIFSRQMAIVGFGNQSTISLLIPSKQ